MPVVDFGRDVCGDFDIATKREWLITNGMGGYGSGTLAEVLTRRYHGLLVAALDPPGKRTLMVSKLEATAHYDGQTVPLYANRWASGIREREGAGRIERFHLDGRVPTWRYGFADALLERRVWMERYQNTTYVQYTLIRGQHPVTLDLRALVNYRDHHSITFSGDWKMDIREVDHGVRVHAHFGAVPFQILSKDAVGHVRHVWYKDFYLAAEAFRGLESHDDHLMAAEFQAEMQLGESITIVCSSEEEPDLDGNAAFERRKAHERKLIDLCPHKDVGPEVEQLVLAANQFIVRRPMPDDPEGRTIIAGYHWFGDWGRDMMIALPGLTLVTGRTDYAEWILRTFAQFVDLGMLPNTLPEAGEQPRYNSVDASLWFFEAVRTYHEVTGDDELVKDLYPVLIDIIKAYTRGARFGIKVDPSDGLLMAGEKGVQLTWMDAKIGDWVVTPRTGKAVEVNALWYNALKVLADFARLQERDATDIEARATIVKESFQKFWSMKYNDCFDVIDGPDGVEDTLRPNQILAVSLTYSPLTKEQQKLVVDTCARHLLTSFGLRSLWRQDSRYEGTYGGDQRDRDTAYHQGTVWAWLIGPFVQAHLKVYRDRKMARSFLEPLIGHMSAHGLGTISEIFDGNPPYTARGCIAQAWSVAEVLHAWSQTI